LKENNRGSSSGKPVPQFGHARLVENTAGVTGAAPPAIAVGSTVRTGDDGVAVLVTTPGSAIQLGNSSVLKINKLAFAKSGSDVTERTASLQLTSGVVSALIDPSTPKITDFQVQTPEGAAAARGTFYAVLVYHGKTYVGCKEGHVAVRTAGQ